MTPSDIEKSRRDFIAAASHRGFDFSYTLLSGGQVMFNDEKIDLLWEGFLLRQESQLIELPKPYVPYDNLCFDYSETISALNEAGINYRERE